MDKLDASKQQRAERLRRHSVELAASVRRADGGEATCIVRDLSLEGCGLAGNFNIGEVVEIRIRPVGIFQAQIRWALRGRAGARFFRQAHSKAKKSLSRNTSGVAAIEYAILLALIAIAIVGAIANLGSSVEQDWQEVNAAVTDPSGIGYNIS